MSASGPGNGDGVFLSTVTGTACHDLMNVYATFSQAFGLMEDCLAADVRTRRRTLGIKGGFEYRERFVELLAMMRGQLARAVGLTEALALAAHSLDQDGRPASPPEALTAVLLLAERLLKRRKITAVLDAPKSDETTDWPAIRRADYLGPVLLALLACLPHLPMGGEVRLACQTTGNTLTVTFASGEGGFCDEARQACLDAARAAGAEIVPGDRLTLVFREQPTTPPASCPPAADGAS